MDLGTLSLGDALGPVTRVRRLFTSGETGVWYDPSDLGALFQDSAGTTPVTAVTQPVGLMLDKSNGLVLGPELMTNGDFSSSADWNIVGANITIAGGTLNVVSALNGTEAYQANRLVSGKFYKVTFTVLSISSGGVRFSNRSQTGPIISSAGTYTSIFTGTNTNAGFQTVGDGSTYVIDNISVKELHGYHATQPTSTARPVAGTNLIDFDGVDDAVTLTGSGGGTTGFFLCAAVRPDGGAGAIRTIWSDAGTNTGYIVRLNALNQLEIAAGNGTTYTLAATTATLTVGTTYVITAWDDGTNLNVQVNSGTAGTAARPVVSAGTATVTIGKDNGAATGFFNGAIYPLIYVKNGQNVDALDRAAAKAFVAGKAGVGI